MDLHSLTDGLSPLPQHYCIDDVILTSDSLSDLQQTAPTLVTQVQRKGWDITKTSCKVLACLSNSWGLSDWVRQK